MQTLLLHLKSGYLASVWRLACRPNRHRHLLFRKERASDLAVRYVGRRLPPDLPRRQFRRETGEGREERAQPNKRVISNDYDVYLIRADTNDYIRKLASAQQLKPSLPDPPELERAAINPPLSSHHPSWLSSVVRRILSNLQLLKRNHQKRESLVGSDPPVRISIPDLATPC